MSRAGCCLRTCRDILVLKKLLLVILTPLLLLPIIIFNNETKFRCAYVVILMAIFWTTEAIPLAVTSLIPAFLFPVLEVVTAKDVCTNYIKDTSMLYLCGLVVAVAIEKLNLHKRIALNILLHVGVDPKWLILGLMLPTWLLSMWISNTATTAMMVPIAAAILQELKSKQQHVTGNDDEEIGLKSISSNSAYDANIAVPQQYNENDVDEEQMVLTGQGKKYGSEIDKSTDADSEDEDTTEYARLCKGCMICIAYAANVGGIATLTGTPPNLVLQGQAELLYVKYGSHSPISYTNWMIFALPLSVLCFVVCWGWCLVLFLRSRCCATLSPERAKVVKGILRDEYRKLGKMSFAEVEVLIAFIVLALLWLSRNPVFIPGWGALFRPDYVKDSTPAVMICILLFILPRHIPQVFCCRKSSPVSKVKYTAILDWDTVQHKVPWGVILLFGGGFALADGCQKSGLSDWVGNELRVLQPLDPWVINLILTFIVAGCTEVTSNLATATLLMPILSRLAIVVGVHPLYFMMSAVIATSFAFCLPVATPPNAIVFSYGYLKVKDMASAGLLMNIVCVLLLTLAINTWASLYFNLTVMPDIFKTNTTMQTMLGNVTAGYSP